MSWQGIAGHDDVVAQFIRAIGRGRLATTFLFVGPAGIGKRAFAEKLAQALLCPHVDPATLAPCNHCDSCVQAVAHTHPDLAIVEKPRDKSFIPLSAFVGDDQHRMREGLCHDIALRPFMGGRKVAIIDDADYLNEEGANCLLKTLEEPPPRSVLILIGTSADRQLPTIRSRAQILHFHPLPNETVADILLAQGLAADRPQAARLAELSEGSVQRALELADESLWTFRAQLFAALAKKPLDAAGLAAETVRFIEAAGKDAAPRRNRTRQLVGFAIDYYRQLLRAACGLEIEGDADLARAVQAANSTGNDGSEAAVGCIDRSVETLWQIDRNAHQATLVECWLDDLAQITASGRPVASYQEG